jgi:hypothetical protein
VAEVDFAAGQCGEFGDAQAGFGGGEDQGMVAAAGAGAAVGDGEQGLDLAGGEPGDQGFAVPFGRDGEHAGDERGVAGFAQGGVGEQGADRGQPGVAGAGAVAAGGFQVVQECGDQRGVEVADVERGGLGAGAVAGEGQQQPVAVSY